MAGKKGTTFGNPGTIRYWLIKGYSEEDAIKNKDNFWKEVRQRKIKEYGSDEEYKKRLGETCSLKRENAIKRFESEKDYYEYKTNLGKKLKGKCYTHIEYWLAKGFSEDEARNKVIEASKLQSIRCKEYWMKKGYTEEEAIEKISKIQNTVSLSSMIARYGEKEGKIRYESYMNKVYAKTLFKDSDFQSEMSKRTRYKLSYWIEKGFSEDEAKMLRYDFLKTRNCFYYEYWINKGYTEDEARSIVSENSKKASRNVKIVGRSQLEEIVFKYIKDIYPEAAAGEFIWDEECNKKWFPDIICDEFIIEVYGDYWHANPNFYSDNDIMYQGKLAKQIREHDKHRISRIFSLTKKPIIIIWEHEINKEGLKL